MFYSSAPAPVTVNLGSGTATGEGTDTLVAVTGVFGSDFDDSLTGAATSDIMAGQGGNDTIAGGAQIDVVEGGEGADVIDGGADLDATSYFTAQNPIVADLITQKVDGQGKDTLSGIESVGGSDFGDDIRGDDTVLNILFGFAGDDFLDGRGGFDSADGGEGTDTCLNMEDIDPPGSCELTSALRAVVVESAPASAALSQIERAQALIGGEQ